MITIIEKLFIYFGYVTNSNIRLGINSDSEERYLVFWSLLHVVAPGSSLSKHTRLVCGLPPYVDIFLLES